MRVVGWRFKDYENDYVALAKETYDGDETYYNLYRIQKEDNQVILDHRIHPNLIGEMANLCTALYSLPNETIADFIFWFCLKHANISTDFNAGIIATFTPFTEKERDNLVTLWEKDIYVLSKTNEIKEKQTHDVSTGKRSVDAINYALILLKNVAPELLDNAYSFSSTAGDVTIKTGYTIHADAYITPITVLVHYTDKYHWTIQATPED